MVTVSIFMQFWRVSQIITKKTLYPILGLILGVHLYLSVTYIRINMVDVRGYKNVEKFEGTLY